MNPESAEQIIAYVLIILLIGFIFKVGDTILRRRKQRVIESEMTPFTKEGLEQFDDFAPGEAVMLAWSEPGDFPRWHNKMQEEVRAKMPVLARALDRLIEH